MVGDDQLARPGRGDEPRLDRHAVMREECDVLVLEIVLGRPVQDWGPGRRTEPVDKAPQRLVALSLRGMAFVLNVCHRRFLSVAIEPQEHVVLLLTSWHQHGIPPP